MCTAHALVQTIIQSYSPSEFRGRTMAIFHMSQVVMTAGAMLFGALSSHARSTVGRSVDGRRWRADHDRDLSGAAGCPAYPISNHAEQGAGLDFPVPHPSQYAVIPAVAEVNGKAEQQPDVLTKPVFRRKGKHQHAGKRRCRALARAGQTGSEKVARPPDGVDA